MASSIASCSSSLKFGGTSRHQIENNILKLKLKKPKSWNWEISTSKSSAHINFPRVLLYDSYNKLLADVAEADFIVNGNQKEPSSLSSPSQSQSTYLSFPEINQKNSLRKSSSFCTSNSSNGTHTTPNNELFEKCKRSQNGKSCAALDRDTFDMNGALHCNTLETTELADELPNESNMNKSEIPIFIYSAKGLIKRDFNAKEFDGIRNNQQSQDPTNNHVSISKNMNNIHRKKSMDHKKVHRAKSVNSLSSIMNQNNNHKMNSSSSEVDEKEHTAKRPIYYLQKSVAGVLIVPDEENSNRKIRRRHRSKSTEHLTIRDLSLRTNARESEIALNSSKSNNTNETREFADNSKFNNSVLSTNGKNKKTYNNNYCKNPVRNVSVSSTLSNNGCSSGVGKTLNDDKLQRKVSFVQLNCETSNENRAHIHEDCCNVKKISNFHGNKRNFNTNPSRHNKTVHISLKKSASAVGFCNHHSQGLSSSDQLSDNDNKYANETLMKRKSKRRHIHNFKPISSLSEYLKV